MEAEEYPAEEVPRHLEREVFDRVFADYSGGVRALLRSKLASEADVQDCFNRVFEKLWVHGSTVNEAALGGWVLVVARREAALHWRKQKAAEVMISRFANQQSEDIVDQSPLASMITKERIESVRSALDQLPDNQREIIQRRFVDGQSFREIAEALGIPLGTALTRLHSTLKRLRALLDD